MVATSAEDYKLRNYRQQVCNGTQVKVTYGKRKLLELQMELLEYVTSAED